MPVELLGRVPSPEDSRDHRLRQYVPELRAVLDEVDARPAGLGRRLEAFPYYAQHRGSCVGHGNAEQATIDQRRDHRRTIVYDAEAFYDRCKELDGIPNVEGTYPRVACKLRADEGIAVLSSRRLSEVGTKDQIGAYAALTSLREVKAAIYLFGSAGLGTEWFAEWDDVDPATLSLPSGSTSVGGHYFVAFDWSDRKRTTVGTGALLCLQTWESWRGFVVRGRGQRFWLPYEFLELDSGRDEAWRAIDIQGD